MCSLWSLSFIVVKCFQVNISYKLSSNKIEMQRLYQKQISDETHPSRVRSLLETIESNPWKVGYSILAGQVERNVL